MITRRALLKGTASLFAVLALPIPKWATQYDVTYVGKWGAIKEQYVFATLAEAINHTKNGGRIFIKHEWPVIGMIHPLDKSKWT